jgi:hypothetical protein
MIRLAFQQLARKQARHYWDVIALIVVLFLGAGSAALYYHHLKLREAKLSILQLVKPFALSSDWK